MFLTPRVGGEQQDTKNFMITDEKTVYIETSIVSYLTARSSGDLLVKAWRKATIDWWDAQRHRFGLFISDTVLDEAGRGDKIAAAQRLDALSGIPVLAITEDVLTLSRALVKDGALPRKAIDDSLHIAIPAVHCVDYLLTWNCRHIDNAEMKPVIRNVCTANGFTCPEICTPQELMGGFDNG
jgi:hypothetical protein